MSPANPLLSDIEEEGGGEANSLNVVRVSGWHAVLCILSKAWASCSLSNGVEPDKDAKEPRREPRPRGSKGGTVEALGESWEDITSFASLQNAELMDARSVKQYF